jgi:hypothetical protein
MTGTMFNEGAELYALGPVQVSVEVNFIRNVQDVGYTE